MTLLPDITERFNSDILDAFKEIQQSRSAYQINKFVVNQHETPEMQYYQCILEIQSLYYTIKNVTLDMQINEIKIARLRETKDPIDELEAQKLELGLAQTRLVGVGTFRELDILLERFNSFSKKYTRKEIEEAQPQYWNQRLNRQALFAELSSSPTGMAQLEALYQIQEPQKEL